MYWLPKSVLEWSVCGLAETSIIPVRIIASTAFIVAALTFCCPIHAQTADRLLQQSLAKLQLPELKAAYALHPDVCSIDGKQHSPWTVMCEGVPLHFYRQTTVCDPGPPKECGPAPADYTDCRTFSWDIDASGNPSSAFGSVQRFDRIQADCLLKSTAEADQAKMAKRGIALVLVEILDYAGSYTGKPRPIK
jgi:hypothetical protein